MKTVGVLGSGVVGQALATGFIKHGYKVMIGTRDHTKLTEWKTANGPDALVGSFDEAAEFGQMIVLATKGIASHHALRLAGTQHLDGKTIIDATNPIADGQPTNGVIKFFTTLDKSLMEELQAIAPNAHFVKAFNCVGNSLMVDPDFGGTKPTMFICGNNEIAKREVRHVLDLFGWETEDLGKAEAARAIEPLCILWCIPGFLRNDWVHAFKVLKQPLAGKTSRKRTADKSRMAQRSTERTTERPRGKSTSLKRVL